MEGDGVSKPLSLYLNAMANSGGHFAVAKEPTWLKEVFNRHPVAEYRVDMRKFIPSFLATAVLAAGLMPFTASAQDRGVVYAGGSVGDGANGYAGGVIALPGNQLGDGLAVRGGVNGGEYRYTANGQRIEARYIGAELALVYQASGEWGYANLGGGLRVTDTRLSPLDPGNRLRGTRADLALQTDGAVGQTWRAGWFGSFGVNDRTYIAQLRVTGLVSEASGTRLGIEGGAQGDRSYDRQSLGAVASTRLGDKWEGVLSGGASFQEGRSARPYVTLGVSHVF